MTINDTHKKYFTFLKCSRVPVVRLNEPHLLIYEEVDAGQHEIENY